MNQIPLTTTIEGESNSPKLVKFNKNLISSSKELYSRPAFVEVAKYADVVNGVDSYYANANLNISVINMFEFSGSLYTIYSGELYLIDTFNGTATSTLSIPNTAFLFRASKPQPSYNGEVVIPFYDLDLFSNTATAITLPSSSSQYDVIRVSSRYVFLGDDVMYFSDVNNATSIQPLSFFDAETYTDRTVRIARYKDDLIAFGENSIERFSATSSATTPFRRIKAATSAVGYVGGLASFENDLFFVGRDTDGSIKIFSYGNSGAVPISSPEIDGLLNSGDGGYNIPSSKISENGESFIWNGNKSLIFNFSEFCLLCTFTSSGLSWSFIEAAYEPVVGANINSSNSVFGFKDFTTMSDGRIFCHDRYGVYELKDLPQDVVSDVRAPRSNNIAPPVEGDDTKSVYIEAYSQTYIRDPSESYIFPSKIEVNFADRGIKPQPFPIRDRVESFGEDSPVYIEPTQITSSEDQKIWLETSKNGIDWTDKLYYSLDDTGVGVFNPLGGLGRYKGYMGLRIGFENISTITIDNITYR